MKITDINAEPPMWDLLWERADLPDALVDEWRAVMAYRTKLPDDAEILAAFGWTPTDVLAARNDPSLYWPAMHQPWTNRLDDDPAADGDAGRQRAALMALAEETARYHDSQARLAREIRTQYMVDLAHRLPKEQRWSHETVGLVLSLTKQRVQQILRNGSTRDPNMPIAAVPGPGSAAVEAVTEERRRKLTRLFSMSDRATHSGQ